MEATAEQRAACEAFASGSDLALVAGAGTGKTVTAMHRAVHLAKQAAVGVDCAVT